MSTEGRPATAGADFAFDTVMAELLEVTHFAALAAGLAGTAADRVAALCAKAALLREKAEALTEKAEAGAMRVEAVVSRAQSAVSRAEAAQQASGEASGRVCVQTQRIEQSRLQAPPPPVSPPMSLSAPPAIKRTASQANNSSASPLPLSSPDAAETASLDDLLAQVLELSHKAEAN